MESIRFKNLELFVPCNAIELDLIEKAIKNRLTMWMSENHWNWEFVFISSI